MDSSESWSVSSTMSIPSELCSFSKNEFLLRKLRNLLQCFSYFIFSLTWSAVSFYCRIIPIIYLIIGSIDSVSLGSLSLRNTLIELRSDVYRIEVGSISLIDFNGKVLFSFSSGGLSSVEVILRLMRWMFSLLRGGMSTLWG